MFNLFDTIGKYISKYFDFGVRKATILVYIRFIFFFTFLSMILPKEDPLISSDLFCLFNMAIFALTHGWSTSANMSLGPQMVLDDEKETAGFILNFPLQFGIFSGTILALSLV